MDSRIYLSKRFAGFTLVELVIVIILIAILAGFIAPRFININSQANQAAVNSVASALNAATAINYAKRKANSSTGSAFSNCTNAANLLPGGVLPSGYSITSLAVASDAEAVCTVLNTTVSSMSATFVGLGIS